jgi:hypothetical protein
MNHFRVNENSLVQIWSNSMKSMLVGAGLLAVLLMLPAAAVDKHHDDDAEWLKNHHHW